MSKDNNKDKLRVYEYAKSLNMSSKEIITILKRLNVPVNNHMSVMEPEMVLHVEKFFHDIKANAAAKRAASQMNANAGASKSSKPGEEARPQPAGNTASQKQTPAGRQTTSGQAGQSGQTGGRSSSHSRQQRSAERSTQGRSTDQGGRQGNHAPSRRAERPAATPGASHRQGGEGASPRAERQHSDRSNNERSQGDRSSRPKRDESRQPAAASGGKGSQDRRPNRGQASSEPSRPVRTAPVLDDSDDRTNRGGKTTRKTKSNAKRFDDNKASGFRKPGGRNNRSNQRGRQPQIQKEKIDNTPKKVIVRGEMTVGELAKLLHKDASEVIKKLMTLGTLATINQEIDLDAIHLVAAEYKVEVELKLPVEEDPFEMDEAVEKEEDLLERPPVVTIMGHVDHGKTTLLDAIRKTHVSEGEAGGITQHIGAYQVEVKGKKITFLDTPGHEAFTTMRARGAKVTDITILVVAADDGVMPQTVEAINHAKAANVPIIVAVNKIDKPEANPDKIKQSLTEYGLVPEEWGGETIFANVSAKQKMGLDDLLEMILLVAEVQELKANPNRFATGTVIEAELDKGRGPVARVLVQQGTLRIGDAFVAGVCFGRARAMVNDKGRKLKEAGPSTPIELTGLSDVPQAGDRFIVFEDERKAREISDKRSISMRESSLGANKRVTLDDLYKHIQEGDIKELPIILKGDVQGSVEALRGSLEKIEVQGVRVRIIHAGAGAITESDIILASASNAIIIGFNVRPEPAAAMTADQEKVDIRLHSIIYKAIEEIEQAMKGMLDPEYVEKVIGHAEVRNLFKISRVGTIAGCMVTDGKVTRNSEVRLVRGGIVVHEGKIDTLKRFKDEVREVAQGYECGITLEGFNDLLEGDIVEAFVMETVER